MALIVFLWGGEGGGVIQMFKKNGWDLVWPFFMDEKVGEINQKLIY